MPRIWAETIAVHRDTVREAILDAAGALVAEHGLTAVTMSGVARLSGIGRATLYKYYPDVESVLTAWHDRQVSAHLRHLAEIAERIDGAATRLTAVLAAYADLSGNHQHGGDVAALLHRGDHVARAHEVLHEFVAQLIRDAAGAGYVRGDVPARELAVYCLAALDAAGSLPTRTARDRLVDVTLAGLRATGEPGSPRHRG